MRRWVAVGIGALLMLWVPFLYWELRAPSAPASEPEAEPAPLAEEPSDPAPAAPAPAAPPAPAPAAPSVSAQPPPQQPQPEPAPPQPAPEAAAPEVTPSGIPVEVPASSPEVLAELKAAYGGSSRDDRAGAVEADLRSEYAKANAPPDMLRSLSCHAAACKAELVWSRERAQPFMRVAMTWAARYTAKVAMEPGPKDEQGFTPVTMYFTRGRDPDEFVAPP